MLTLTFKTKKKDRKINLKLTRNLTIHVKLISVSTYYLKFKKY